MAVLTGLDGTPPLPVTKPQQQDLRDPTASLSLEDLLERLLTQATNLVNATEMAASTAKPVRPPIAFPSWIVAAMRSWGLPVFLIVLAVLFLRLLWWFFRPNETGIAFMPFLGLGIVTSLLVVVFAIPLLQRYASDSVQVVFQALAFAGVIVAVVFQTVELRASIRQQERLTRVEMLTPLIQHREVQIAASVPSSRVGDKTPLPSFLLSLFTGENEWRRRQQEYEARLPIAINRAHQLQAVYGELSDYLSDFRKFELVLSNHAADREDDSPPSGKVVVIREGDGNLDFRVFDQRAVRIFPKTEAEPRGVNGQTKQHEKSDDEASHKRQAFEELKRCLPPNLDLTRLRDDERDRIIALVGTVTGCTQLLGIPWITRVFQFVDLCSPPKEAKDGNEHDVAGYNEWLYKLGSYSQPEILCDEARLMWPTGRDERDYVLAVYQQLFIIKESLVHAGFRSAHLGEVPTDWARYKKRDNSPQRTEAPVTGKGFRWVSNWEDWGRQVDCALDGLRVALQRWEAWRKTRGSSCSPDSTPARSGAMNALRLLLRQLKIGGQSTVRGETQDPRRLV
ncbi:MAG: hypothetical protein H7A45_03770 [Verrucomicrobiales bacterium]|nr:hypothetical protein [Verrucomicrobiales bacterium]